MTMVSTTLRSAYLAGPMRGIEDFNFPEFHKQTAWLRGLGWKVFSPAERDEADEALNGDWAVGKQRGLDYFMQFDLAAVCQTDCVICLPGWEGSQGARLETVTAVEVGHPVFEIEIGGGKSDGSRRLRSVNPDYIQLVFQSRGFPEHDLSEDCWCRPERESFAEEVEGHEVIPGEAGGWTVADEGAYQEMRAATDAVSDPDQIAFDRFTYEGDESSFSGGTLPTDSAARKGVPLASGVLDYFPAALIEVAKVSKAGNDKHNPGQPLHHARGKSTDHADALLRHLVDRGKVDAETGQRHSAEVAWRALALLQQELEDAGLALLPRGAREEEV